MSESYQVNEAEAIKAGMVTFSSAMKSALGELVGNGLVHIGFDLKLCGKHRASCVVTDAADQAAFEALLREKMEPVLPLLSVEVGGEHLAIGGKLRCGIVGDELDELELIGCIGYPKVCLCVPDAPALTIAMMTKSDAEDRISRKRRMIADLIGGGAVVIVAPDGDDRLFH